MWAQREQQGFKYDISKKLTFGLGVKVILVILNYIVRSSALQM